MVVTGGTTGGTTGTVVVGTTEFEVTGGVVVEVVGGGVGGEDVLVVGTVGDEVGTFVVAGIELGVTDGSPVRREGISDSIPGGAATAGGCTILGAAPRLMFIFPVHLATSELSKAEPTYCTWKL